MEMKSKSAWKKLGYEVCAGEKPSEFRSFIKDGKTVQYGVYSREQVSDEHDAVHDMSDDMSD